MEAKELRIGNLIDLGNRVAKVIEIYHAAVVVVDLEKTQDTLESLERCQPIPLTEQWLIDLGFKGRVDFVWKGNVGIQIRDGKFYLAIKDLSNVIFHSVVEIKFVHKLQNLYYEIEGQELNYNPKQ